MTFLRSCTGAAALAFTLALTSPSLAGPPAPSAPTAEAKAEALKRFNRGVELSKEGDARSALIEFRRAYELLPNYRVLYNIGQVHYELQDYVSALRSFEEYLATGGKEIAKKRRAEVEKEVEKLKGRVASATISVDASGAEVSVDDVTLGKAPLPGPVLLNPGKRKVSASASGRVPGSKVIEVAGGDKLTVELKLEEEKAAEPPPPPPPPPPPARVPWVAWGVTGVLAASTAVVGVLALRASSQLSDQRESLPVTRAELTDTRDRMRTLSITADILGGATVVAGAVATYLTLRRPSANAGSSTSLLISPSGVALGGRF